MSDATNAAALNYASGQITNAVNVASAAGMNRKRQKWAEKMYDRQRADALADWNRQNEYNDPSAQMQRLKAAGLNPHLVYGNGADVTAGPVRSSDSPGVDFETPQMRNVSYFDDMYDFSIREAQTDNLRAQNTVIAQEALLKAAQTEATMSSNDLSEFELGQKQELKSYVLEAAKKNVEKMEADIDFTKDQGSRADYDLMLKSQKNAADIKEVYSRMASQWSQQQTDKYVRAKLMGEMKNLELDMQLKTLDKQLKEEGLQPSDPAVLRILLRKWKSIKKTLIEKSGIDPRVLN